VPNGSLAAASTHSVSLRYSRANTRPQAPERPKRSLDDLRHQGIAEPIDLGELHCVALIARGPSDRLRHVCEAGLEADRQNIPVVFMTKPFGLAALIGVSSTAPPGKNQWILSRRAMPVDGFCEPGVSLQS
jgi:hypothetical protein